MAYSASNYTISIACTTDSEANAQTLAQGLLEARKAACVQISAPIESRYWWEGKIETAREWRLTIKTASRLFEDCAALIRKLHPYSTPQILATPIVAANPDYLEWMEAVLSGNRPPWPNAG